MDFSLISFSVTTVLSDRKYKEDCMVDSEGGIQNVVIQTGGERKSSSGDIFWWQMSNQGVSGFFSLPGVSVPISHDHFFFPAGECRGGAGGGAPRLSGRCTQATRAGESPKLIGSKIEGAELQR